ncbi:uncharacterized protein PEZ65_006749 [Lycodopsis pacificus]
MQSMTEAEAKKRQAEVDSIEDRMKSRVETLIEEHDRALRHADDYYSAVQKELLLDQNKLKDELAKKTKLQTRVDKKLSAAEQEKKRLSEALQEAQQKLPELQKQQHDYKQTKIVVRSPHNRSKSTNTNGTSLFYLSYKWCISAHYYPSLKAKRNYIQVYFNTFVHLSHCYISLEQGFPKCGAASRGCARGKM